MKLADGTKKMIAYVLIALSVIAALKLIITDYTLDEEYQLLMAYRNIRGDAIFGESWEPHQTSAFFCIGIMFLYKLIVGSYTGVIIATRVVTTLIQAGLSVWIFFTLKRILDKDEAFLAGILFFAETDRNSGVFQSSALFFYGDGSFSHKLLPYTDREKRTCVFSDFGLVGHGGRSAYCNKHGIFARHHSVHVRRI